MRKLLLILFCFILIVVSCSQIKEGRIKEKIIEPEEVSYKKEEITRQESYYDMMSETWRTRTVYTGRYEYFKIIDTTDYIIIITKTIETKKGPVQKARRLIVSEETFNNLEVGDYITLTKENKKTYRLFRDWDNKIEISKEEYFNKKN